MRPFRFLFLFVPMLLLTVACKDDRQEELQLKQEQKDQQVFAQVSNHWQFRSEPTNPAAEALLGVWTPWRDLMRDMGQKPQSSIEAFQKRAAAFSAKAKDLATQLPPQYRKPEVLSRIAVLSAKINALDLFIHLKDIPADKVNRTVDEINASLQSLQLQFDEIERKSRIPKEQGESDFIRMLDTTRAVPTNGVFPGGEPAAQPQTRTASPPSFQGARTPLRRPRPMMGPDRTKKIE